MTLEEITELEILAQHVEALVPTKALQLSGMCATIHPRRQRAALEAVAAELAPPETRGDGAGLYDQRDGLRR